MNTLTIGEVADRTGFPASTLRYYERIGLVQPAARSAAGYRLYDDHALAKLTFIERAKRLGCSLDDIADLVTIWDRDECGPVQRRFHELVTANIRAARIQIADLAHLASQLEAAAAHLSGDPIDGPCGDGCACATVEPDVSYAAVAGPVAQPVAFRSSSADVPIACSLELGAMAGRFDDWRSVLDRATSRSATAAGGLRIEFDERVDVAQLSTLMAAEQACCAFFSFALTIDHRGVALEVTAPGDAAEVVAALFGGTE